MKKEYSSQAAKDLSEKSDTELIDIIAETTNPVKQALVKAILDKRFKRVVQYQIKIIEENNKSTDKSNKNLTRLTTWILVLTVVMAIPVVKDIWEYMSQYIP